jgi:hypothetical protein
MSAETYIPDTLGANLRWDRFKRFYVQRISGSDFEVVEFPDTKERVVKAYAKVDPHVRRVHAKEGFTLWGSADDTFHQLELPDGTPVKRTWLNDTGQQILLLDHRHKIAVKATGHTWRDTVTKPHESMRWGSVYYPDAKAGPIAAGRIDLTRPIVWSPEHKQQIRELRDACRAWVTLHPDITNVTEGTGDTITANLSGALAEQQRAEDPRGTFRMVSFLDPTATLAIRMVKPTLMMQDVVGRPLAALTVIERFTLAYGSVLAGTATTWEPWLRWKPNV